MHDIDTLPVYEFIVDVRITNRNSNQSMTLDYGQDGYSEAHAQSLVKDRVGRFFPVSVYDVEIKRIVRLPFIDRRN